MARKLTDTVKLQVRLSERLRRRLEQAAKHNDWSMNTEIVSRLDVSFQREDQEEMIRRATQEAVKSSAGALFSNLRHLLAQQPPGKPQLSDEEQTRLSALSSNLRHLLAQQPPGKPQLSDEEQTRLSADKEEKSK